jgi:hypothetical protein
VEQPVAANSGRPHRQIGQRKCDAARVGTLITLKRQSDLLRRMAQIDALTGLANRRPHSLRGSLARYGERRRAQQI